MQCTPRVLVTPERKAARPFVQVCGVCRGGLLYATPANTRAANRASMHDVRRRQQRGPRR